MKINTTNKMLALVSGMLLVTYIILKANGGNTKHTTLQSYRINKLTPLDPNKQDPADSRQWIIETEEGYRVLTKDRSYQVGDSVCIIVNKVK